MQKELGFTKITLSQLSDTRWVCRFKSCDAHAIVNVLSNEIDEQESKDVVQAISMLNFSVFNKTLDHLSTHIVFIKKIILNK